MSVRTSYDPHVEHAALRDLYDEAEARLERPAATLLTPEPDVSGWSVGHHLYHVARVNKGVFLWLRRTARAGDAAGEPAPEPHPLALRVLESGTFGRGRVQAPERVRPPDVLSREALAETWQPTREQLGELAPHLGTLGSSRAHTPHPVLGSLTTDLWLRFAHVHTAHHLAIVRKIEEAQRAA